MAENLVDVHDLKAEERKLAQLAVQLLDLRPFWPRLVPHFIEWMRMQYETEGAFGGHPWPELSPAYRAWKAKNYPTRGILVGPDRPSAGYKGGQLRRAASTPVRTATPDTLTLSIVDPKVRWHQEGTPKMPARPLVFDELPILAQEQVDAEAEDYVLGVARGVGLLV